MPRLLKDPEFPNLFQNPRTQIYYFRKYVTEVGGQIYKSLKETNRNKAIRKMNQILSELKSFKSKRNAPTIDDVVMELYEIYQGKSKATFENFEHYCRSWILPFYTGYDLKEVAPDWERFKRSVRAKKPGMYLDHVRRHLRTILKYAARRSERLLDGVPILELLPAEISREVPRAFEDDEVAPLFEGIDLKEHKIRARTLQKYQLQAKLTLLCGLRPPSEINNLEYVFFDFARGLLHLPKDFVKTRTARTVPIPDSLILDIRLWKKGELHESRFLFHRRGDPSKPATSSDKSWQRVKKAINLRGKRYWFRHSHGTAALEGGMDPIVVAKNMGTSREMLERVYTKPGKKSIEQQARIVKKKYASLK